MDVIVDGTVVGTYQKVAESAAFSPDGKQFRFHADTGTVVVDGVAGDFRITSAEPDWAKPVSAALDKIKDRKAYPWIANDSVGASPDGSRIAYVAGESNQGPFFVVDNGKELARYGYIYPKSLTIGPGGRVCYGGFTVDPKDGSARQLSPDWKWKVGKPVVVVDNTEVEGTFEQCVFSIDGKHVAVIMEEPKPGFERTRTLRVDGIKVTEQVGSPITHLQFSPDGEHLAYWQNDLYRRGLFVDGQGYPVEGHGAISMVFQSATVVQATLTDGKVHRRVTLTLAEDTTSHPTTTTTAPVTLPSDARTPVPAQR